MLIINADDFGYFSAVNAGVIHCFERGLCTSASIMPNMPGFEEACRLAHEHGLEEHIGLHLVLTEGEPLTQAMRASNLFCSGGRFSLSRSRRVLWLSGADRSALAGEIRAQVAKCRQQGLPLTHMDSHNHAHEEWAIGSVVIALAQELAIPRVRVALTFTTPWKLAHRAYRWTYNARLRRAGLARSQFFGREADYLKATQPHATIGRADFEIMLHPIMTTEGAVCDRLTGCPIGDGMMGVLVIAADAPHQSGPLGLRALDQRRT